MRVNRLLLLQVDKNHDGRIDYAEFCQMMLPCDSASQCNAAKFAANWAKKQKLLKQEQLPQEQQQHDTSTSGSDQHLPAVVSAHT